ncbi:beta-carotene 15,15'-monooxygenase, partial [Streptococcus suis]
VLIAGLLTIIGAFFTDGGTVYFPFILITYLGRESATMRTIAYGFLALVLLAMSYQPYEMLEMTIQMML